MSWSNESLKEVRSLVGTSKAVSPAKTTFSIPPTAVLTIGSGLLQVFIPYSRYVSILKWLTLSLFAYVATVLIVIGMFYWIIKRAFDIGRQAIAIDQTFAGLTAKGIAIWIGVQTFINMGVNLGLLPTKGLTLPLMSYGGTGVLINCIGLAILLRIDYENRILMRGGRL